MKLHSAKNLKTMMKDLFQLYLLMNLSLPLGDIEEICVLLIKPDRYLEIDLYLAHRVFSAKCAAMLLQHNIKIDWSKGDSDLHQRICDGSRVNSRAKCHSTLHSTSMCIKKSSSGFGYRQADSLGRDIQFMEGTQNCKNFNRARGCSKPYSKYLHICKQCKSKSQGKFNFSNREVDTQVQRSSNTSKQIQSQRVPLSATKK